MEFSSSSFSLSLSLPRHQQIPSSLVLSLSLAGRLVLKMIQMLKQQGFPLPNCVALDVPNLGLHENSVYRGCIPQNGETKQHALRKSDADQASAAWRKCDASRVRRWQ